MSLDIDARPKSHWILPDPEKLLSRRVEIPLSSYYFRASISALEKALRDFHVHAEVVEVNAGPAFIQYRLEVKLTKGQRTVQQIRAIRDDLELVLASSPIRIQAPIPGTSLIGIEVPRSEVEVVSLRELLLSKEFGYIVQKSELAIALGRSVDGFPFIIDLMALPHLLIGGTSGSGKSTSLSVILSTTLSF